MARRAENRPQLRAQQVGAERRETDAANAEKRIVLSRQRQVGQRLVAADVEFFSIGTNDLAQYTLAMDRSHPILAPQLDALHPAVLHLIDLTVRAARRHGRRVAVCGALGGEEEAVPILLGLGIEELSVSVPVVASIKERVRTLRAAQCRALSAAALSAATAADVRALVRQS